MNKIKIKIPKDLKIIKLIKIFKINIYTIEYNKDNIHITIDKDNLKEIAKLTKYTIIKEFGINNLKKQIKQQIRTIMLLIIFIILITMYSKFIIKIETITENKELKELINEELLNMEIKPYKVGLNNNKLKIIKKEIINNNKDKIEWLNIKKIGMKYQINIEEKVSKKPKEEIGFCNIVAKQEGTITKVVTKKGTTVVDINDHVKKDTILISGETKYNEEIKNLECAEGDIYAKTWYTINLILPKQQTIKKKDKKHQINIYIKTANKKRKIFKSKHPNPIIEKLKKIKIFNIEIYIVKEYKTKIETIKYNNKELTKLQENLIKQKMNKILKKDGKIISQKVLKKNDFNSKIEIEVFIIAEENIGIIKKE